jgi:hypothetical protein
VVGKDWEPRANALRDLLSRWALPFGFYEQKSVEARRILENAGVSGDVLPILVFTRTGTVLADPSH